MGNDLLVIPCDLSANHEGPCERNIWPVDEIAGRRDSAESEQKCPTCGTDGSGENEILVRGDEPYIRMAHCPDSYHEGNERPATQPMPTRGMEAPAISPVAPAGPPCEAEIPRQSTSEASAPEDDIDGDALVASRWEIPSEYPIHAELADLRAELARVKEELKERTHGRDQWQLQWQRASLERNVAQRELAEARAALAQSEQALKEKK